MSSETKRYAAFLRGVSPMNANMTELRKSFEAAGLTDVKTVLSSGNVVFGSSAASEATLEREAEAAMERRLGKAFPAFVRSADTLDRILAFDPFAGARLEPGAKRLVTFLRGKPKAAPEPPVELGGARILRVRGGEVFSVYVPNPRGAVFMALIERTFGRAVTTRTWDTVAKVARQAHASPSTERVRRGAPPASRRRRRGEK